ncbi:MAG: chorismate pyruvate-lyase family protein [Acidimicrobiales bacterium]
MVKLSLKDPSQVLQELFEGPSTVTSVLEAVTGERVVADVLELRNVEATAENSLELEPGHSVTRRSAVLKGVTSGRRYVRAVSLYAPDRLPEFVGDQLANTNGPIGRILVDHGLRTNREGLARPEPLLLESVATSDSQVEAVWTRQYLLLVDHQPAFVIHEEFLSSVLALALGEREIPRVDKVR